MSRTLVKPKQRKSPGRSPAKENPAKGSDAEMVVDFLIHGPAGERDMGQRSGTTYSASRIVESIKKGLPVRELSRLQASLAVPMERLSLKLGISRATLSRRIAQGRLEPQESDRLVRFAKLMGKAVEVFETEENARHWLTSPQIGLGGAVPLDFAETEVGAREVEDLLGRIEYGVYS